MLNKLVIVITCIYLLCLSKTTLQKKLTEKNCNGCPSVVAINDEIKEVANWTATQMPTLQCDYCSLDAVYLALEIKSAKTQIVSGKNYFLTINYSKSFQKEVKAFKNKNLI